MARIREALRRVEPTHRQSQNGVPAAHPSQPEEPAFQIAEEEEVPFIEVGGRDTPMEASASVLAHIPKTGGRNPQQERTPVENLGTAAAAGEVRLTVLYISFCKQSG